MKLTTYACVFDLHLTSLYQHFRLTPTSFGSKRLKLSTFSFRFLVVVIDRMNFARVENAAMCHIHTSNKSYRTGGIN